MVAQSEGSFLVRLSHRRTASLSRVELIRRVYGMRYFFGTNWSGLTVLRVQRRLEGCHEGAHARWRGRVIHGQLRKSDG